MSACDPHATHAASSAGTGGCITCGDVGIEMRVLRVEDGLALCADGAGDAREVEVGLVDAVAEGDRVLVHADVALVRLA